MDFCDKVLKRSNTEKVNIIIDFYIFKIVLALNFSLNWQFWIFGPNKPNKDISNIKNKKIKTTIEFNIMELV